MPLTLLTGALSVCLSLYLTGACCWCILLHIWPVVTFYTSVCDHRIKLLKNVSKHIIILYRLENQRETFVITCAKKMQISNLESLPPSLATFKIIQKMLLSL